MSEKNRNIDVNIYLKIKKITICIYYNVNGCYEKKIKSYE